MATRQLLAKSLRHFLVFSLCIALNTSFVSAQDVLFTQNLTVAPDLNPALTGKYNGTYRASIAYRNQWLNVLDQGYESFKGALDLRFNFLNSDRDRLGFGVVFFADKSGETRVNQYEFAFQGAIHKSLGYKDHSLLSLGFNIGPSQRNLDYSKLFFADQFSAGSNSFTNPTQELFPENTITYASLGLGIDYEYSSDDWQGGIGLSAQNLTPPNISQFNAIGSEDQQLKEGTYNLSTSLRPYIWTRLPLLSEQLYITPRITGYLQDDIKLAQLGATLSTVSANEKNSLYLGVFTKMGTAVEDNFLLYEGSLMFGITRSNLNLGFSYDINIPSVQYFSQRQGTFEFTMSYIGTTTREKPGNTPIF